MQDLLNPPLVKEHNRVVSENILQVKNDLNVPVNESETKHLDNLCDGTVDRALYVGRLESTIFNELLV